MSITITDAEREFYMQQVEGANRKMSVSDLRYAYYLQEQKEPE